MDYLPRALQALKEQDLPSSEWELLVIDNASERPVCGMCDVSWRPNSRHVLEEKLGPVPARLRGIRESTGSVLLFVDDDNVLQSDYLREALRIAREWPILGVWGGHVEGVFEVEPSSEVLEYLWMLGVRSVATVQWSNATFDNHAIPIGAGMCIRRAMARRYAELATAHPLRFKLDRRGIALESSGDIDMALTACDMGLGIGRFPSHLIPRQRLTDDYLFRLIEGISYSDTIVIALRQGIPAKRCRVDRLVDFYKRLKMPKLQRSLARAVADGRTRALNDLVASTDGSAR